MGYKKPDFSWGWSEEDKKKILDERRTDSALLRNIDNLDELTCCYAVLQDYEWIGGVTEDEVEKITDFLKTLTGEYNGTLITTTNSPEEIHGH